MINLYFFSIKVSKKLFRSHVGHNSETSSCGDGIEHDSDGDWGGDGSNEPQHREMAGNVAPALEVLIVKATSHTLYREKVVYTHSFLQSHCVFTRSIIVATLDGNAGFFGDCDGESLSALGLLDSGDLGFF
ncbi:hypothetical protein CsSME_00030100 [Camellia sinensis var. sinensis]